MFKKLLFVIFLLTLSIYLLAQTQKDSASTNTTNEKPPKQKEVKKLDDPLLLLPADLIYKIQQMKPDPLLDLNERIVRNERRTDEYGDSYEVTVTVRLGFSQDMITGIVKEVPLYQSASRETNIIPVKIPVKFCCTTKMDSVHTKKHCGKMSELNDLESNEHCKDWMQDNGESAGDPDVVNGIKSKKKTAPGKPTVADSTGFGKPVTKPSKKDAKGKMQNDSSSTDKKENVKSKKESKKEKAEAEKKDKKENDAEEFGKPKTKQKGKSKSSSKKEKEEDDAEKNTNSTDSTATSNKKE